MGNRIQIRGFEEMMLRACCSLLLHSNNRKIGIMGLFCRPLSLSICTQQTRASVGERVGLRSQLWLGTIVGPGVSLVYKN